MSTFIDRIEVEIKELNERYTKLESFILSGDKSSISSDDVWLLHAQKSAMAAYLQILHLRLDRAKRVVEKKNPESNN
jgi:hypothetical protein